MKELDPRLWSIRGSMSKIKAKVFVVSSKGGVGKTLIATLLGLSLADMGLKVGVLDLDVTNPGVHVILGLDPENVEIRESNGILPVEVAKLKLMSIIFFTKGRHTPLRGKEISNAIREVIAVTNWGNLDVLIVDIAPGLSDEVLEALNLIPNPLFLVTGTPSKLVIESVKRIISMLLEVTSPNRILLVENMTVGEPILKKLAMEQGIHYLGSIPYDPSIEEYLGAPGKLLNTKIGTNIKHLAEAIIKSYKLLKTI